MSKNLHVVPRGNRWGVLTTGSERVSRIFATQGEAIESARARARRDGTVMYIHGQDGRIRERSSYGQDPLPPKG